MGHQLGDHFIIYYANRACNLCLIGPLIEASTFQLVHCLLFEPKSKDGWFCRNEIKSKSTTLVLIQRLAAGSSQRPNNCSHFHHNQAQPASPRDKLSQTIFGGFSMAGSCNLGRRTRLKSLVLFSTWPVSSHLRH